MSTFVFTFYEVAKVNIGGKWKRKGRENFLGREKKIPILKFSSCPFEFYSLPLNLKYRILFWNTYNNSMEKLISKIV